MATNFYILLGQLICVSLHICGTIKQYIYGSCNILASDTEYLMLIHITEIC